MVVSSHFFMGTSSTHIVYRHRAICNCTNSLKILLQAFIGMYESTFHNLNGKDGGNGASEDIGYLPCCLSSLSYRALSAGSFQ